LALTTSWPSVTLVRDERTAEGEWMPTASTICNLFRRYPVSSTGISEIGSKAHSGNRDRNL